MKFHSLSFYFIMENSREISVSAPGKIIFHGEHAVVYGKPAVAASLSLRSIVTLRAISDSSLSLQFEELNIHKIFSLHQLGDTLKGVHSEGVLNEPSLASDVVITDLKQLAADERFHSDSKEIQGIVVFLYLYYNICRDLPALSATVTSDIPVGAGFGSSGAFCASLSAALLEFSGHITSERNCENQGQWSAEDLELINKWAFVGEQVIHGNPSGVDNTVSCLGGGIMFVKGEKVPITPLAKMPTLSIMLVNTNVPRSTKDLVARFRQRYIDCQEVCDPLLTSMAAIARRSVDLLCRLTDSPADHRTFSDLGELMHMNQHLLNAMGVGHPALDKVVATAAKYGLHAKLTGAGGGGCAFVLISPNTDTASLEKLMTELQSRGCQVWQGASVGGPGLRRHL